MSRYTEAKEIYLKYGVDTEKALEELKSTCISAHCWQGDDVVGFDSKEALSGDVWNEYLARENVASDYLAEVKKYEQEVLVKRI